MKSTGIVRRVDNLGRLVIPKEIRKVFGIDSQQGMEIFTDGQSIIISKHHHSCIFCDGSEGLAPIKGKYICRLCSGQIGQPPLKVVGYD